jgi:hypothetical protein
MKGLINIKLMSSFLTHFLENTMAIAIVSLTIDGHKM